MAIDSYRGNKHIELAASLGIQVSDRNGSLNHWDQD